jgi:hypothetical protein
VEFASLLMAILVESQWVPHYFWMLVLMDPTASKKKKN